MEAGTDGGIIWWNEIKKIKGIKQIIQDQRSQSEFPKKSYSDTFWEFLNVKRGCNFPQK